MEAKKFTAHTHYAVSLDLCTGGLPKPYITICWPRIVYSQCNFYRATMTITGTFIREHSHDKVVIGTKKLSSQNCSPKCRFFENVRVYKIQSTGPQKALPYPIRRHWGILRKHPFSLIEEPKKRTKKLVTTEAWQNHVFGEQKPLNRSL